MNRFTLPAGAFALGTIVAALGFRPAPVPLASGAPCGGPFTIDALPCTINEPGLYCVTDNLNGTANENGITVNASGVVIDLQGYQLSGNGGLVGIVSNSNEITVRNGGLIDWANEAILLQGFRNCVENVVATECGSITLGEFGRVERSRSDFGTGPTGFDLGAYSVARDSRANSGATDGFNVGDCVEIERCSSEDNSGTQFRLGDSCHIVDSIADSGSIGIEAGNDAHVEGCSIDSVNNLGIECQSRGTVVDCKLQGPSDGIGILVGIDGRVRGCTAQDWDTGIRLGHGSTATECTARRSESDGFTSPSDPLLTGPFRLENCLAEDCFRNGIVAPGGSRIAYSRSQGNVLAGIRIEGDAARIESNELEDNGTGIEIVGQDNLIIRNSFAGNATAYVIPYNNTRGPFLTSNSWITSTNPWANFKLTFP